jgi:hypothetical protein
MAPLKICEKGSAPPPKLRLRRDGRGVEAVHRETSCEAGS